MIVDSSVAEASARFLVGVDQVLDMKCLRRLHAQQMLAVDRAFQRGAAQSERVCDWKDGNRAVVAFERGSSLSTTGAGQKGRAAS